MCPESQEPPPLASGQVECGPREHVGCAHRGHGCTPPERQPHRRPRRDVGRPGGRENESSRIHHDSTWWRPPLGRLWRVSRARPRWREGADPRVPPMVTVAFGMDPPGAWEQGSEGSRPPGGCSLSGLSWASGTALWARGERSHAAGQVGVFGYEVALRTRPSCRPLPGHSGEESKGVCPTHSERSRLFSRQVAFRRWRANQPRG